MDDNWVDQTAGCWVGPKDVPLDGLSAASKVAQSGDLMVSPRGLSSAADSADARAALTESCWEFVTERKMVWILAASSAVSMAERWVAVRGGSLAA